MPKSGPIIIVEDDLDDQEIITDLLRELRIPNELLFFPNSNEAYQYLIRPDKQQPFIIFSDINLPGENGLDFKNRIDSNPNLRQQSIPFVFLSTFAGKNAVDRAYTQMSVQGFFEKPSDIGDFKNLLYLIIDYWKRCRHPNSDF